MNIPSPPANPAAPSSPRTGIRRIALVQLNPTVGDFAGNVRQALAAYHQATQGVIRPADLVVLPELFICGYPPKDLLEHPPFIKKCTEALTLLAASIGRVPMIVGCVAERFAPGDPDGVGKGLYNSAAVLQSGKILSLHHKSLLPTYDVFDEHRYFEPGRSNVVEVAGTKLGITICEDAWNDPELFHRRLYSANPVAQAAAEGAELLVNIAASPFTLEKRTFRTTILAAHAKKHRLPLVFVNQVGGQDDLIFDGHSLAFDPNGRVIAEGKEMAEGIVWVDFDTPAVEGSGNTLAPPLPSDAAAAFEALVLGTRDYARRCGFRSAVIGLSGGIDSSLVAAIAVAAFGRDQVVGVAMPSRYSSDGSLSDAKALAAALGMKLEMISIEPMFRAFLAELSPMLAAHSRPGPAANDTTPENLQARVRGTLLMALSNRFGHLVLSTGNKSELAVGYCTLYGDMVGGLAVLSDVPKTLVYELCRYANTRFGRAVIPETVFTKAPSAELRPNQTDQDTLPPYDILDAIIERYVEDRMSRDEIVAAGFAPDIVDDVLRRIWANEYKRRQAAPGLKITSKAFGSGRRMPIAHGFRER